MHMGSKVYKVCKLPGFLSQGRKQNIKRVSSPEKTVRQILVLRKYQNIAFWKPRKKLWASILIFFIMIDQHFIDSDILSYLWTNLFWFFLRNNLNRNLTHANSFCQLSRKFFSDLKKARNNLWPFLWSIRLLHT